MPSSLFRLPCARLRLLAVAAVALLAILAPRVGAAEREVLVLLHTNDIHANFQPIEASWRDDGVRVGGGPVIGYNGNSGNAAVPHLHLAYIAGGVSYTNPYQLMVKLCR